MATKRQKRKPRERILPEGGSETLTVQRIMGDLGANISRKALRYLKVRPGDKLQVNARNGVIEISPILTAEQEIEKFLSH